MLASPRGFTDAERHVTAVLALCLLRPGKQEAGGCASGPCADAPALQRAVMKGTPGAGGETQWGTRGERGDSWSPAGGRWRLLDSQRRLHTQQTVSYPSEGIPSPPVPNSRSGVRPLSFQGTTWRWKERNISSSKRGNKMTTGADGMLAKTVTGNGSRLL